MSRRGPCPGRWFSTSATSAGTRVRRWVRRPGSCPSSQAHAIVLAQEPEVGTKRQVNRGWLARHRLTAFAGCLLSLFCQTGTKPLNLFMSAMKLAHPAVNNGITNPWSHSRIRPEDP